MSTQMMMKSSLVVVCSLAALVALASAQGWNPNGCSQGAQKAVDQYNSDMSKLVSKLISQLSKHGQDSANVNAITAQANAIMESLSSLANSENLTDIGKIRKIGQQTLDAYIKLGSLVFRTESVTNAVSIYAEFASSAVPNYATFINKLISACGPSSGSSQ